MAGAPVDHLAYPAPNVPSQATASPLHWAPWLVAIVFSIGSVIGCASPGPPRPDPEETIRARIAQVVDADTGRPVEGAIVLMAFYLWPSRGWGNFPFPKVYRDSVEAMTDRDGRFSIVGPFDPDSWSTDGVYIFKPGYGPWRFQGASDLPPMRIETYWSWLRETWGLFTTTGVVIELRPLRNVEERLKYIDRGWGAAEIVGARFERDTPFGLYFFDVPADRLQRFQAMVDEERASLGLPPRLLDGRRQQR